MIIHLCMIDDISVSGHVGTILMDCIYIQGVSKKSGISKSLTFLCYFSGAVEFSRNNI